MQHFASLASHFLPKVKYAGAAWASEPTPHYVDHPPLSAGELAEDRGQLLGGMFPGRGKLGRGRKNWESETAGMLDGGGDGVYVWHRSFFLSLLLALTRFDGAGFFYLRC